VRFVADDEILPAGRAHDVAHVVVPVFGLARPRRNPVPVDVEDRGLDDEIAEPGLFFGFAQRDAREIEIAVRMPAELQPRVQLSMMRQKQAPAVAADEPG